MSYPSRGNVDSDFARLLSRSYGPRPASRPAPRGRAVSLSSDAGTEVLPSEPAFEEYVVERGEPAALPASDATPAPAPMVPTSPAPQGTGTPPEGRDAGTRPDPYAAATTPAAPSPGSDTAAPAPQSSAPPAAAAPAPAAPSTSPAPVSGAQPAASTQPASPASAQPASPASAPPSPAPQVTRSPGVGAAAPSPSADVPSAGSAPHPIAEDDLAADMQAILTGQKVYDPNAGGMRERSPSPPPPPPPVDPAKNEQAIFDRITESMAYSNAFDLGTVELERRFQGFDREAARRATPPAPVPLVHASPVAPVIPAVPGPRAFIEDLSHIEDTRSVAGTISIPLWGCLNATTDRGSAARIGTVGRLGRLDLSRPFFDTGEHVRAGDDAGVVPLPINGVTFGYGDIIAMPDFFENPEDLTAAAAGELEALRGNIRRSAEHYRAGTGEDPVSDQQWQDATGDRYLRLAADNYSHFAPPATVQESFAQQHTDHRARFAQLHQQALRESQRLHLAHPSATPTLESALVINAFADHFLTDAFASGHLVNKELVISRFRSSFFSGANLTAEGNAFFERVAERAFRGDVAAKFSVLEQYDPTIGIGGVGWHANINSASRFATLLQTAARQEPVKIANVAIKALHDHLNRAGVQVANGAGAAPWQLHGDEALDATTLGVMRQAIAQSVANLSDPSLLASGVDLGTFVDRVWRFVPVPTAASLTLLRTATQTYTTPTSTVLSDAAADLIAAQVDTLIKELIDGRHLRDART